MVQMSGLSTFDILCYDLIIKCKFGGYYWKKLR